MWGFQRRCIQPVEDENLTARQQRRVELEGRGLGRRTDQNDRAVLDDGQKAILLGPVEAVDLVDEQQRATPGGAALARALEDLAKLGHAREDRGQGFEFDIAGLRQQAGDGRLAGARRTPQDHGREPAGRRHAPNGPVGGQQVILSDHFGQAAGPQAIGQRPRRQILEQAPHAAGLRLPGREGSRTS